MGQLSAFQITVIIALIIASVNMVKGQISTPCTTAMINSFTPCANFITGSANNGLTPSTTCCDTLRSLMSNSMDCACLIITANAPFPLPINRVLAQFLPQTCNTDELPLQCKASGSPLPAPGPAVLGSNGQTPPPIAESPSSPQVSITMAIAEAPKSETLQSTLAPVPVESSPMKQKHPRKLHQYDQYF